MSETVTEKVSVRKANGKEICAYHIATIGQDKFDVSDYEHENGIILVGNNLFKYSTSEMDSYGFTHVTENSEDNLRFITQYYNDGCQITEIIEDQIKKAIIYE